ncbi:MAG: Zn-dependent protease, partial [Euryarchaeota archaeon]|nr:Zn-dependent protease [Euryarchaeota archaeon]
DIRVDDSPEPLAELRRLLTIKRAYDHADKGDLEMERGDMAKALFHYSTAESMVPDNIEMMFWHAVTLANNGHHDDAKHLFSLVFEKDEKWRELARRLVPSGLLKVTDEQLERIVKVKTRQCSIK